LQDRNTIRDSMRAKRNFLSDKERNDSALSLLNILRDQAWFLKARSVANYLSCDGEIRLTPAIEYLLGQQQLVTLPVIGSQAGQMQFCKWSAGQPLTKNRFGILEPEPNEVVPLDAHSLILTPLVAFDDQGDHTKCRKSELTLGANEQPPEQTEQEVVVAEEKAVAESLFDEEAAGHKIEKGSFAQYRDIHAIYSDQKKMVGNRKYLRFRAKKAVGGDTLTQEMCHRYLVGIQDEEYLKEVGA